MSVYADTCGCCVVVGRTGPSYNHTTARHMVPAYTKCDVQLKKVAPDDSTKHVEHLMENKV